MRLIILLFLFLPNYLLSQVCYSGSIYVNGTGCGCLNGCDLTTFGGPDCGSGVIGNCQQKHITVFADILVNEGCNLTVESTVSNRPSCSASGADSGDGLKVDLISGNKTLQTGSSNSTLYDSYTLSGPGVIRVTLKANRMDEIATYNVIYSDCDNCLITLPIELIYFNGKREGSDNILYWSTSSEINNDRFELYSSEDGEYWELVGIVNGSGNSSEIINYNYIHRTNKNLYYKLKQVDYDGKFKYFDIVYIKLDKDIPISTKYFDLIGNQLNSEPKSGLYIEVIEYIDKVDFNKIYKY